MIPPKEEQEAYASAVALHAGGRTAEAEQVLLRALANWPQSQALHELLAAAHMQKNDAQHALASLEHARTLGPLAPEVLNLLALCYLLTGAQDRALSTLDEAIALDPQFAPAHANAGWINVVSGNLAASSRYLRSWLRIVLPAHAPPGAATGRRKLPDVTVVCIDCAYHELAIDALRRTLAQCDFGAACFFTDRDYILDGIKVIRIDPVTSAEAYSNFVMHRLAAYIETDFVLIVQYDGFVLHAQAWDDDFLNYDYIGAKILLRDGYVVGNGGFSLRSKKLLCALGDATARGYDALNSPWLEDMAICVLFREHLEKNHGIRFAPGEVADRFSSEASMPTAGTFGFHNLLQLAKLVENDFRAAALPQSRRMTVNLHATTPLGPYTMTTHVTLQGTDDFDRKVQAHRGR